MLWPINLTKTRAGTCLGLLLANASCMPMMTRHASAPSRFVAAAPAPVPSSTAAPSMLLLRPPPDMTAGARADIAAPPFDTSSASSQTAAHAAGCLTAAVYYEARSEPRDGQRAVAQVVLNRVRNPAFPPSVCGVVYQRSAGNGGCQFSFACDGSMLLPRDAVAWRRAERIAADALAGHVYAPAGAATFYHATSVVPWWSKSLTRVATIGAHIFYSLGNGWRGALDFRQAYAGREPDGATMIHDDRLPTAITRHDDTEQSGVSVHTDALRMAGVTVHRGTSGADTAAEAGAGTVQVHVGMPPIAGEGTGAAG